MVRTVLAVGSMGAAVAIFSCTGGTLVSSLPDASTDACGGHVVPAVCVRRCDGATLPARAQSAQSCPAGYTYVASYCTYGAVDGGPVVNTCGDDGGVDGPLDGGPVDVHVFDAPSDACSGRVVPPRCRRLCDGDEIWLYDGGTCPNGYTYLSSFCIPAGSFSDGWGPVTNTCTSDAGPDVPTDAAADHGGSASGVGGAAGSTDGSGPLTGSGGTAGGGAAGGACTDLVNDAPAAPVRFHSGDRPADTLGAGGDIVDGVYDLNAVDIYRSSDSSPPDTSVTTIRISSGGTRMEYVSGHAGDGGIATVEAAILQTLSVSGTQVTETRICGQTGAVTEDYTATPTRLMLSNPLSVKRYVRR